MRQFTQHQGTVVCMDRANVDTDQIIPKQFLKRIERTGFGQYLFYDWRFQDDGSVNPQFELNQPGASEATILVARHNFGCGSSREHAVWALEDYGFRVIIAPSFADIFYNNCFKNGLLPIRLNEADVEQIAKACAQQENYQMTADLENCLLSDGAGLGFSFSLDEFLRECLLRGLDEIAVTLQYEQEITAYEARQRA